MYDIEKIAKIKKWLGSGSINIFGRPFAGKDAQGIRLAKLFDGNLVGGGEILRGSAMPNHIKEYMRTGKLIPTNDYVDIVLPYLSQPNFKGKPLLLSSVGRWHGEEDGVVKSLDDSNHPLKAVVFLDISNDESYTRWLAREVNNDRSKRHDDTKEILDIRFSEFEQKTLPVFDYYNKLGILISVNGKQSRDDVTKDIIEKLYKLVI